MTTPSFIENANAKPLNKAMMEWFGKHELPKPQDKLDPRIELSKANQRGLPRATIITAQIDPLRVWQTGRAINAKRQKIV